MVIRQEYPNIRTKSIDLELSDDGSPESAADLVLGECLDSDSSMFVAYRNAQRWVQTYEPVVLDTAAGSSFRERRRLSHHRRPWQYRHCAISEYLARNYKARLVLVGRSCRSEATTRSRHSRALGAEVVYVNANVADATTPCARAVEEAYQRFGTLHGVIHAAGIVGDNGLQEINDCTHDNCERHFRGQGTWPDGAGRGA